MNTCVYEDIVSKHQENLHTRFKVNYEPDYFNKCIKIIII